MLTMLTIAMTVLFIVSIVRNQGPAHTHPSVIREGGTAA